MVCLKFELYLIACYLLVFQSLLFLSSPYSLNLLNFHRLYLVGIQILVSRLNIIDAIFGSSNPKAVIQSTSFPAGCVSLRGLSLRLSYFTVGRSQYFS
jgi:hypothetical protein